GWCHFILFTLGKPDRLLGWIASNADRRLERVIVGKTVHVDGLPKKASHVEIPIPQDVAQK
ncbi:MAG: hypothetical protein WCI11_20355, partial [Candidatus Methylumidiphilus sp.]